MRRFSYSAVSMLFLLVYGMVLLHNFLPHQHQAEEQVVAHHSAHDDHHGHDHDHHSDHNDSDHNDSENSTKFPGNWSHPFSSQDHLEEIAFSSSSSVEVQQLAVAPPVHIEALYAAVFDERSFAHPIEQPPILYELISGSSDPQRGPPSIV